MHTPTPRALGPDAPIPGRGAAINPPNRFERLHVERDPDADLTDEERPNPRTQFFFDATESILSKNDSPDIPFTYSVNPYRGCEHGCAYCYARSYHDYLGWSAGIDFETKILVKLRAPALLRAALSSPRWEPQSITFSGATDCYQPAERHFKLTRGCLEVCLEFRNPVALITKNALITRDRDLLGQLAGHGAAVAFVSVTSLDSELAGKLEPRAARPQHRLHAIRELAAAGIPVGVMVAPIIPGLTDHEMPAILAAAAEAGATTAGYTIMRLPLAVKDVFLRWLEDHAPGKKDRVLSRVRDMRGGKLNVSDWGERMRGEGIFAEQTRELFAVAARRAGLASRRFDLSAAAFRPASGVQLTLF